MGGLQPPLFGGDDFGFEDEDADYSGHVRKVRVLMSDGCWWSGVQVARALGCMDSAGTARIRDLRKEEYGSHIVDCRLFPDGVYRYRLVR